METDECVFFICMLGSQCGALHNPASTRPAISPWFRALFGRPWMVRGLRRTFPIQVVRCAHRPDTSACRKV